MNKLTHLNTDDLILFMDRELDQKATAEAEQHLLLCIECGSRLQSLQKGSAAHHSYQQRVLKPALQTPENNWPSLADRLNSKPRFGTGKQLGMWWAAAAIAATLALVFSYLPMRGEPSADQVLDKAQLVPESPSGEIVFTTNKLRFARPAVLETGASEVRFQHVQALFIQSNYSWNDPLNARSFANWRRQLPDHRDYVTAIREDGVRKFYRIRTRTDSGILHSAALTLEASTYHPTKASFEFQGEDLIEVSPQSEIPQNKPQEAQTVRPVIRPKGTETLAGPEEELRVFAALDAIGADAEEDIDVKRDTGNHSVLVTGMGMTADRRKRIETALASIPNTVVRFSTSEPVRDSSAAPAQPPSADSGHASFLQKLQDMAGGARQLQTITDESLETSNSLFAQSHSLLVLAKEFPPPVEATLSPALARMLLALRQRHVGAMNYALRRLRDQVRPLLKEDVLITEKAEAASWQSESENLYESTRNLDRLLSRLLAGSYEEGAGEQMLKQLPDDISKVETLVIADSR